MFRVSARTVLELGSELISSDIIAFYELIKNAFDAHTKAGVEIHFDVVLRKNAYLSLSHLHKGGNTSLDDLRDKAIQALDSTASEELIESAQDILRTIEEPSDFQNALDEVYNLSKIVISDTGSGMSLGELGKNFLVLGTPSRKREMLQALESQSGRAPYLGEKGIGRLSAMRLGNRLRVESARVEDTALNVLEINWEDFADLEAMIEDIDVKPMKGGVKPSSSWSGTRIIIGNLAEDWTKSRVEVLVENEFARLTDPFLDQKKRPRIVIFWNGERLAIPWMDQKLTSHAHATITGAYKLVDGKPQLECALEALYLGFEHPKETERHVIAVPDLHSALLGPAQTQEVHDTALVTTGPFEFEAYWFNRRLLGAIEGIGEMKLVRELQQKWSGILLFRDGFRVFPYGEDEDDWLALDRRALGRAGYTLNKAQFVGRVMISRIANPELVDQTNREGLRETPEQKVFVGIMQFVINTLLWNFLRGVERQYKSQRVDLTEAKNEISSLETRAKSALKQLKRIAPQEGQEVVQDLQQTFDEFSDFAERARQRIAEIEKESRQMIEMAGLGMMVEVVAHELARASENALENLDQLRRKSVPAEVQASLESLRAQMKTLSKRVRILDELSIPGRQRAEEFSLKNVIEETLDAHLAQFKRHQIVKDLHFPRKDVRVKAVKGMVVQILENLISNSKYWMQIRGEREPGFVPGISIAVTEHPPTIVFEDNGLGVAPQNRERIFEPFFSLKHKSKRRGLGLFIARECARYMGGSLTLSERIDPNTGRLHRFVLELPETSLINL